jgi:hypothetical protein
MTRAFVSAPGAAAGAVQVPAKVALPTAALSAVVVTALSVVFSVTANTTLLYYTNGKTLVQSIKSFHECHCKYAYFIRSVYRLLLCILSALCAGYFCVC